MEHLRGASGRGLRQTHHVWKPDRWWNDPGHNPSGVSEPEMARYEVKPMMQHLRLDKSWEDKYIELSKSFSATRPHSPLGQQVASKLLHLAAALGSPAYFVELK